MMINRRTMVWLAIAVATTLGLMLLINRGAAQVGAGAATPKPSVIAVADIQKVLSGLKEKEHIENNVLKVNEDDMRRQDATKKEDIEKKQKEINDKLVPPGSSDWVRKMNELEQAAYELQAWRQMQNARMNRERSVQTEMLYKKILDAVGRVAAQKNIDLVLFKEAEVNFRGADPNTLPLLIQSRKLLYSANKPDMEITQDVIQLMNNEFKIIPGTPGTSGVPVNP